MRLPSPTKSYDPSTQALSWKQRPSNRSKSCLIAKACPGNPCQGKVQVSRLATEAVEGAALAFQGVDNIERGDGLALSVFGVGDGVTNDAFEEGFEDATGLFVNHYQRMD